MNLSFFKTLSVFCAAVWLTLITTVAHAQFTHLYDINRTADGSVPNNAVMEGTTLFGTTGGGAANNRGALWSFDTETNTFTNLHDFTAETDGRSPAEIAVSGSTIFGVSRVGGTHDDGTLWSYDTGTDTFTALHHFSELVDGVYPDDLAVEGATVFGTAELGGPTGSGILWSFDTGTSTFANLHSFSQVSDGRGPTDFAVAGTVIYGLAGSGGTHGEGTVWSFDTVTSTLTKHHDFPGGLNTIGGFDGIALAGTKIFGTSWRHGEIWSVDTATNAFATLHDFTGGLRPADPIISGATLYGTSSFGSGSCTIGGPFTSDCGSFWSYEIDTDTATVLHDFSGVGEGFNPSESVALAGTKVFGTTAYGREASRNDGTIWSYELPGLAGDFDGDGDCDGADFLALQRDPSIGSLSEWQTNYGQPAGAIAATSRSIPEPVTWMLLAVFSLAMVCHYRVVRA